MEHINRIELQGHVGTVRHNEYNGKKVVNFSLATEFLFKSRDGQILSELTWHNIVAWEGKDIEDPSLIAIGTPVYVCGRLKATKYTSADGVEKIIHEVSANKLRIVKDEPKPL